MKDLSQLIELPIKVDVSGLTHQEREELQKKLFEHGVRWGDGSRDIETCSDFNFISQGMTLTHLSSNIRYYFEDKPYTEIKIESLQEILGMKPKQFAKSELKDGMVVLLRGHNDRHVVINNRLVAYDGWMDLDSYDNNLLEKDVPDNQFDVVEVFEVISLSNLAINQWQLKSIWKREEKSQTQLEIEAIQKQVNELNARLETLKGSV